jgi:anaerobic magnesium-protoporphyrin IX monomethyl ester cyclase
MKIAILDVYKNSPYRVTKDTNGGYGVENDLGQGLIPQILSRIAKKSMFWPPLTALNLISEFHQIGAKVAYCRNIEKIDNDVEYIFISVSIVSYNEEINAVKRLKEIRKNAKIFIFGSFLNYCENDFRRLGVAVIIGEPEFLAQQVKLNRPNLNLLHDQGKIKILASNPDNLAPARWAQYVPRSQNYIAGNFSGIAPILATRGCPYSCFEYCTYPLQQGRKVRTTDPLKVVEDINFINKDSKVNRFIFRDPVFSINKKYTVNLLQEMANKLSKKQFTIETHLNNIDTDMADLMAEASIARVKFGIESASPDVMENVSRHSVAQDEQAKAINILKARKIKTDAMYIICQPLDTYQSIDATIDYSIYLNTDLAQFSIFTPYPGTPYFEKINKANLLTDNWGDFTQFRLVYKHTNFTPEEARKMLGLAYKRYYVNKLFKR